MKPNVTTKVTKITKQPTTGTIVRPVKKAAPKVVKKKTTTTTTTKKKTTSKVPVKPAVAADPYAAAVAAAEQARFGPAQAALESQQRAQAQRTTDTQGWYQQYQAAIAAANNAQAQTGLRVQQGMAAFGNAATANDAQGASSLASQMQADAAARGATVDPATLQRGIDAAAVRRDNGAGLGKLLGINVEAGAERGAGAARNAGAQGFQAQLDGGRAQDKLLQSLRELGDERGAFRVTQRQSLVDADQRRALENFLTTGKLEVDKANAETKRTQVTVADQNADADRRAGLTKAQIAARTQRERTAATERTAAAKRAADARKPGRKPKSKYLAPAGQNSAKDAIDSAATLVRGLRADYSQAEVRKLLLNGSPAEKAPNGTMLPAIPKVPKAYLNVAMDIIYLGGISKANVSALHARGIKVKPLGYKTLGSQKQQTVGQAITSVVTTPTVGPNP